MLELKVAATDARLMEWRGRDSKKFNLFDYGLGDASIGPTAPGLLNEFLDL